MRVVSRRTLQDFWNGHTDSEKALRQWFKTAQAADWQNLIDVRRVYPHADIVNTPVTGALTVFNVCGNKYRLIVRIRCEWQLINIRCVLTHSDYDKGKWKV
jgi:mRNA interferase HigB